MSAQPIRVELLEPDLISVVVPDAGVSTTQEHSVHNAAYIKDEMLKIYAEHKETVFRVLLDLSELDLSISMLDPKAMATYDSVLHHEQTKRIAVFGEPSLQMTVIKKILIRNNDEINWFSNREEAMAWLAE